MTENTVAALRPRASTDGPPVRIALTIWQPWAWAIIHAGKDIENRSWAPGVSLPQRLAIHAGKTFDDRAYEFLQDLCSVRVPDRKDFALGAILGTVLLAGWSRESTSPWFAGPVGWQLKEPLACEPIFCRGAQGLWAPPTGLELPTGSAEPRP